MGRRRKRFLQTLEGGPLDKQKRWMWGNTETYFYPTPEGERRMSGRSGKLEVPCHVYRHTNFDRFIYCGVEDMKINIDALDLGT